MPQGKRRRRKVPRAVSCASVSLERVNISRRHRKRQERERRSAWPRRREGCGDSKRDATTNGERQYANIGHMEPGVYMSVKQNIHKSKHNINEKFAKMPSQVEGSKDSAVLHILWRLKAMVPRWPEHIAPLYASQEDVKGSVVNAWQISPFCHFLVVGPSCLTEPSAFKIVVPQGCIDIRGSPQGSASRCSDGPITKLQTEWELAMAPS